MMETAFNSPLAFNVRAFGARGDGTAVETGALQAAVDACSGAGGGTVYVPAGRYVTGSISLRSHVTLYLDAGATILGSQKVDDYPVIASRWEGLDRETYAPLIGGAALEQVAVVGRGTVDGRGALWWDMHREGRSPYPRPRLISFDRCRNLLVEGLTLLNSPSWTIHPLRCENVTVDKVTIVNPPDSPNTDGINPDSSRNVHISNCHVDVGDDCVTIKSGIESADPAARVPCENVTVTNCTMVHGHGGVVVGSEMSGGVRNIAISNCIFVGTDRGIRMKSRRGRGGWVEDVRVSNIVMQDVLCPFTMNLYYHIGVKGNAEVADRGARPVNAGTPYFRGIHFAGITVRDAHYAAAFLYGLPERPIEEVSFRDVSISMSPQAQAGAPDMADDVEPTRRGGFFARHVRGLYLDRVEIKDQAGPPFLLADIT